MRTVPGVLLLFVSALAPSCGGGGAGGAGKTAWPSAAPNPPPPGGATPLPTTFRFGLGNGPGGTTWMNGTTAAWGYRYQYLSGNVNGSNWSQWNSPPGEF